MSDSIKITQTEAANRCFLERVQQIPNVTVYITGGETLVEQSFVVEVPSLRDEATDRVYDLLYEIDRAYSKAQTRVSVRGVKELLSVCTLMFMLMGIARADKTATHVKSKTTVADAKTVQARKTVQDVYDRQAAAMRRKDINGFLAPFTPDYQDVKYGNHIYTAEHLRQQLPGLIAKYPPGFKFNITIQKFKLEGDRAKATANYHLQLTRTDAERHRRELWTSDTVSEDAWIKKGQNWRLQSSRETQFKNKKTPLSSSPAQRRASGKSRG